MVCQCRECRGSTTAPDPLEQEVDRLRTDFANCADVGRRLETRVTQLLADLAEAQSALRARDVENEAKAAVIAAMERELGKCSTALDAVLTAIDEVESEPGAGTIFAQDWLQEQWAALKSAIRARGGK
jgi:chromosome segregation ATPase